MRFGFIFLARDLQAVGPIAKLGEAHGYDLIGIGDSPSLCHDPFVALAIATQQTSRVRLGTGVTNPQTRPRLIGGSRSEAPLLINLTIAFDATPRSFHLSNAKAYSIAASQEGVVRRRP